MGSAEIEAFLTHLAVAQNAAATQNQALSASLLLYRHVPEKDLDGPIDSARQKKPRRLLDKLFFQADTTVVRPGALGNSLRCS